MENSKDINRNVPNTRANAPTGGARSQGGVQKPMQQGPSQNGPSFARPNGMQQGARPMPNGQGTSGAAARPVQPSRAPQGARPTSPASSQTPRTNISPNANRPIPNSPNARVASPSANRVYQSQFSQNPNMQRPAGTGVARPAAQGARPMPNAQRPMPNARQMGPNGINAINGNKNVQGAQNNPQNMQNNSQNAPNGQPSGTISPDGSSKEENEKIMAKKHKGRRKRGFIIAGAVLAVVAIVGILIGILSTETKVYKVSFETGPFELVEEIPIQDGTVLDIPASPSNITNSDGDELVVFDGWYLDDMEHYKETGERTPYEKTSIKQDMTLYAHYTLAEIKSTFVARNYVEGDGYVYLGEITTEYYTENIVFSDVFEEIMQLASGAYATQTNMSSYNLSTSEISSSTLNTTKDDFLKLLTTYYVLDTFELMGAEGTTRFGEAESLATPDKDSIFVVNFRPVSIEIQYNSSVSSIEGYYTSLAVYDPNDFVDYVSEPSYVAYGGSLSLASVGNFSFKKPEYHGFIGWSTIPYSEVTNGTITLDEYKENVYKADSSLTFNIDLLNFEKKIIFYAVWSEDEANFVVYSTLEGHNILVNTTVTLGGTDSIKNRIADHMSSFQKNGYTLIGFNTSETLDGASYNLDYDLFIDRYYDDGNGNKVPYPYFNITENSVVLYTVYKKQIDDVVLYLGDTGVTDPSNYILETTLRGESSDITYRYDAENNRIEVVVGVAVASYITDAGMTIKNWLNYVLTKENMSIALNLSENPDDDYYYDEDQIEFTFDADARTLTITNLLEDMSFVLPRFARTNYNISANRYFIETSTVEGLSVEVASTYQVNSEHRAVVNSKSTIGLVLYWDGKNVAVDASGRGGDAGAGLFNLNLPYGTEVMVKITTSTEGNTTTVHIEFYDENGNLIVAYDIEQEGYSFTGLYDQDGNPIGDGDTFIVGQDVVGMNADWEKEKYTITYTLGEGYYVDGDNNIIDGSYSQEADYDTLLKLLSEDVYREGYFFDGWSSGDPNGEVDFDLERLLENYQLKDNIDLYAHWTKAYEVTLYFDSSREVSVRPQVYRDDATGEQYFELAANAFSAYGNGEYATYNFTNYSTNQVSYGGLVANGGDTYISGNQVTLTGNLQLFAMWFRVVFQADSNYGVVGDNPSAKWATYGGLVTLPREGDSDYTYTSYSNLYYFNGWKINDELQGDSFYAGASIVGDKDASKVNSAITATTAFRYKGVVIRVYQDTNSKENKYVTVDDVLTTNYVTFSFANLNLPTLSGREIAFLSEYKSGSKANKYAYFYTTEVVSGAEQRMFKVPVPVPTAGMSTMLVGGKTYFIYDLYATWAYNVTFYLDRDMAEHKILTSNAVYTSSTTENGVIKVAVSDITGTQEIVMPTAQQAGFNNPNMNFVTWEIDLGTETIEVAAGTSQEIVSNKNVYYGVWEGRMYNLAFFEGIDDSLGSVSLQFGEDINLQEQYLLADNNNEIQMFVGSGSEQRMSKLVKYVYYYSYLVGEEEVEVEVEIDSDSDIIFGTEAVGGNFVGADFDDDNTIKLKCIFEEKTYDIVLDLQGASYSSALAISQIDTGDDGVKLALDDNGNVVYKVTYTKALAGFDLVNGLFSYTNHRFDGYAASELATITYDEGTSTYRYVLKDTVSAQDFETSSGDGIDATWVELYHIRLSSNGHGSLTGQGQNYYLTSDAVIVSGTKQASFTLSLPVGISSFSSLIDLTGEVMTLEGWSFLSDANRIVETNADVYTENSSFIVTEDDLNTYYAVDNTITLYAVYGATITFSYNNIYTAAMVSPISHTIAGVETAGANTYFESNFYVGQTLYARELSTYSFNLSDDYSQVFEFVGWLLPGGREPISSYQVTGSSSLTAYFVAHDYEFTFFNQNKSIVTTRTTSATNSSVVLKDLFVGDDEFEIPTLVGYNFLGWCTNENKIIISNSVDSSDVYFDNSFSITSPKTNLYPVFEKASITVYYYDSLSATPAYGNGVASLTSEYGSSISFVNNSGDRVNFTRTYFDHVGWSPINEQRRVIKDSNDNNIVYNLNNSILLNIDSYLQPKVNMLNSKIYYELWLTAVWERQYAEIKIDLKGNLESGSSYNPNGTSGESETLYSVGDKIRSVSFNQSTEVLTLVVYAGEENSFGFDLPSVTTVKNNGYFVRNHYEFTGFRRDNNSGEIIDVKTSSRHIAVLGRESQTFVAEWSSMVDVSIYANYNRDGQGDKQVISVPRGNAITFLYDDEDPDNKKMSVQYSYGGRTVKVELPFEKENYYIATVTMLYYDSQIEGTDDFNHSYQFNYNYPLNETYFDSTQISNFAISLYIQWLGDYKTINYYENINDVNQEDVVKTMQIHYGATISLYENSPVAREDGERGYELDYVMVGDAQVVDILVEDDIDAYIHFKKSNYTVQFVFTDGSFTGYYAIQDINRLGTFDNESGLYYFEEVSELSFSIQWDQMVDVINTGLIKSFDRNNKQSNPNYPSVYIYDGYSLASPIEYTIFDQEYTLSSISTTDMRFYLPASNIILNLKWASREFAIVVDPMALFLYEDAGAMPQAPVWENYYDDEYCQEIYNSSDVDAGPDAAQAYLETCQHCFDVAMANYEAQVDLHNYYVTLLNNPISYTQSDVAGQTGFSIRASSTGEMSYVDDSNNSHTVTAEYNVLIKRGYTIDALVEELKQSLILPTRAGYAPTLIALPNYDRTNNSYDENDASADYPYTIISENAIYLGASSGYNRYDLAYNSNSGLFEIFIAIHWDVLRYEVEYKTSTPRDMNYVDDDNHSVSSSGTVIIPNTSANKKKYVYDTEFTLNQAFTLTGWEQLGWARVVDNSENITYSNISPLLYDSNVLMPKKYIEYFMFGIGTDKYLLSNGSVVEDLTGVDPANIVGVIYYDVNNTARRYNFTDKEGTVYLYPLWKQCSYAITFDDALASSNITATFKYDSYGAITSLPSQKDGLDYNWATFDEYSYDEDLKIWKHFVGWQYNDNVYTNEQIINFWLTTASKQVAGRMTSGNLAQAQDITFTAIWKEVKYSILLDLNGGSYDRSTSPTLPYEFLGNNIISKDEIVAYSVLRGDGIGSENYYFNIYNANGINYLDDSDNLVTLSYNINTNLLVKKVVDGTTVTTYTFAGWSFKSSGDGLVRAFIPGQDFVLDLTNYVEGATLEERELAVKNLLNPRNGYRFVFYAMYNDIVVSIDAGADGAVLDETYLQSHIAPASITVVDSSVVSFVAGVDRDGEDVVWTVGKTDDSLTDNNLFYTYTFAGNYITLPNDVESYFIKTNYHSTGDKNGVTIVSDETNGNIIVVGINDDKKYIENGIRDYINLSLEWEGNARFVVLNPSQGEVVGTISSSTISNYNALSHNFYTDGDAIYTNPAINSGNTFGVKVANINTIPNDSKTYLTYIGGQFAVLDQIEGNRTIFEDTSITKYVMITDGIIISTCYAQIIDDLAEIDATGIKGGEQCDFRGWVDDNYNYITVPLQVLCGDSELIILEPLWNDIFVSYVLNSSAWKIKQTYNPTEQAYQWEWDTSTQTGYTLLARQKATLDGSNNAYIYLPTTQSTAGTSLFEYYGYRFLGWVDGNVYTTIVDYDSYVAYVASNSVTLLGADIRGDTGETIYNLASNASTTLYAIFQPIAANVKYQHNDKSVTNGIPQIVYGQEYTLLDDTLYADWEWYNQGRDLDGWMITDKNNITNVYATFKLGETFVFTEERIGRNAINLYNQSTTPEIIFRPIWKDSQVHVRIYLAGTKSLKETDVSYTDNRNSHATIKKETENRYTFKDLLYLDFETYGVNSLDEIYQFLANGQFVVPDYNFISWSGKFPVSCTALYNGSGGFRVSVGTEFTFRFTTQQKTLSDTNAVNYIHDVVVSTNGSKTIYNCDLMLTFGDAVAYIDDYKDTYESTSKQAKAFGSVYDAIAEAARFSREVMHGETVRVRIVNENLAEVSDEASTFAEPIELVGDSTYKSNVYIVLSDKQTEDVNFYMGDDNTEGMFIVRSGCSLTIERSNTANVVFHGNNGSKALIRLHGGTLNLMGKVEFIGATNNQDGLGGAIYATAASVLNVNEAYFSENNVSAIGHTPAFGGAIYAVGSSVTINKSEFISNSATNETEANATGANAYGGAVALVNCIPLAPYFTFCDNKFTLNSATSSGDEACFGCGGAIYAEGCAKITIESMLALSQNTADNGGAIALVNCGNAGSVTSANISEESSNIVILDSFAFTGNTANVSGGSLYAVGTAVAIYNSTSSLNNAQNGGALYFGQGAKAYLKSFKNQLSYVVEYSENGGTYSYYFDVTNGDNAKNGGVIYSSGTLLILEDCDIYNGNGASYHTFENGDNCVGGGLYVKGQGSEENAADVYIIGSTFRANRATLGGAIYVGEWVKSITITQKVRNVTYEGSNADEEEYINAVGYNKAHSNDSDFVPKEARLEFRVKTEEQNIGAFINSNAAIKGAGIYYANTYDSLSVSNLLISKNNTYTDFSAGKNVEDYLLKGEIADKKYAGGGIYVSTNKILTLYSNNIIKNNMAYAGGGIFVQEGYVIICETALSVVYPNNIQFLGMELMTKEEYKASVLEEDPTISMSESDWDTSYNKYVESVENYNQNAHYENEVRADNFIASAIEEMGVGDGNSAYYGGALYVAAYGDVTIKEGFITGNSSSMGAIYNRGKVSLGTELDDSGSVVIGGNENSNAVYNAGEFIVYNNLKVYEGNYIYIAGKYELILEDEGLNALNDYIYADQENYSYYITIANETYENVLTKTEKLTEATDDADATYQTGVQRVVPITFAFTTKFDYVPVNHAFVKYASQAGFDYYVNTALVNIENEYASSDSPETQMYKISHSTDKFMLFDNEDDLSVDITYTTFNIYFFDISEDDASGSPRIVDAGKGYAEEITVAMLNEYTSPRYKLSRTGYTFITWAYYENGNKYATKFKVSSVKEGSTYLELRPAGYEYYYEDEGYEIGGATPDNYMDFGFVPINNMYPANHGGVSYKIPAHDIYFYAVWQPVQYNVSYNYDTRYGGVSEQQYYLVDGFVVNPNNNLLTQNAQTFEYGSVLNHIEDVKPNSGSNETNLFTKATLEKLQLVQYVSIGVTTSGSIKQAYFQSNPEQQFLVLDDLSFTDGYGDKYQIVQTEEDYRQNIYTTAYKIVYSDVDIIVDGESYSYTSPTALRINYNSTDYLDINETPDENDNYLYYDTARSVTIAHVNGEKLFVKHLYIPDGYQFAKYDINGKVGLLKLDDGSDIMEDFVLDKDNPYIKYNQSIADTSIKVTLYFEQKGVTVNFFSNPQGIEVNSQDDLKLMAIVQEGSTFVLPTDKSTFSYKGDNYYFYDYVSADGAKNQIPAVLLGFATQRISVGEFNNNIGSLDCATVTIGGVVVDLYRPSYSMRVKEGKNGSAYNLYAIWQTNGVTTYIDKAVNLNSFVNYNVYYTSIENAFADINANVFSLLEYRVMLIADDSINNTTTFSGLDVSIGANPLAGGAVTLTMNAGIIVSSRGSVDGVLSLGSSNTRLIVRGGSDSISGKMFTIHNKSTINVYQSTVYIADAKKGAFDIAGTMNYYGSESGSSNAIEYNRSNSNGGAIYVAATGIVNFTSDGADNRICYVKSNYTTNGNGGAIYVVSGGKINISCDTNFEGNSSTSADPDNHNKGNGGAIYLENGQGLTISAKVLFDGNGASYGGGAIYSNTGELTLVGEVEFTSNVAITAGGAVYSNGKLTTGQEVSFCKANAAGDMGGAIYSASSLVVQGSTFDSNKVTQQPASVVESNGGGAIFAMGNVSITSAIFNNNTSFRGGAIAIRNATATISLSSFTGNSASFIGQGGAIFFDNTDSGNYTLKVVNNAYDANRDYSNDANKDKNKALEGGFVYVSGATLNLSGVVCGNIATDEGHNFYAYGGGIYALNSAVVLENAQILYCESLTTGGAIYLTGSSSIRINDGSMGRTMINYNKSAQDGSALYFNNVSNSSTLSAGEILHNEVNERGSVKGAQIFFSGNAGAVDNSDDEVKRPTLVLAGVNMLDENDLFEEGTEIIKEQNPFENCAIVIGYNAALNITSSSVLGYVYLMCDNTGPSSRSSPRTTSTRSAWSPRSWAPTAPRRWRRSASAPSR